MCHAGLDHKYLIRDVEARVKSVAFAADVSEEPGQMPAIGFWVRMRALFRRKQAEGSGLWHPSES